MKYVRYGKDVLDEIRGDWSLGLEVRLPKPEDLIFYEYEHEGYEGSAFGLFMLDGVLHEVHGSHCSCYGLEGQWDPEATTWEALFLRGDKFKVLKQEWEAANAPVVVWTRRRITLVE